MHRCTTYLKKGLLVLLFVIMLGAVASADTNKLKRVFISEEFILSDTPDNPLEQFFFFFCDGVFINSATENVYLFFSNVRVHENVTGNFYSFFSEIAFDKALNTGVSINTFFSKVFLPNEGSVDIQQLFNVFDIFKRSYHSDNYLVRDDTIHMFVLKLFGELLIIGVFAIFLAIRKSFFEQGGYAIKNESGRILKSGLLAYFLFVCSIVIFMLLVFGIFISIILFAVLLMLILLGSASLSLFLGRLVVEKTKLPRGVYREMVIGSVLLGVANFIPYLSTVTNFFLIPVMALGVVYVSLMNMYVDKNFY